MAVVTVLVVVLLEPCPYDCNNVFGGDAYYDNCGECDENDLNDCVVDCLGEWGGLATHDCNGICDGQHIMMVVVTVLEVILVLILSR